MVSDANTDRFLGALLGLAIGDAVGMPLVGLTGVEIQQRFGTRLAFRSRTFPDGTELGAGEVTDETEIVLCIVESYTVEGGRIDPENIGVRMSYLARGESVRWMDPATVETLVNASDTGEWQQPLTDDGPAAGEVVTRGIPVGLMHSMGTSADGELRADAELVARITHGSAYAANAVTAVAEAMQLAARRTVPLVELPAAVAERLGPSEIADAVKATAVPGEVQGASDRIDTIGTGPEATKLLPTAMIAAGAAESFESCLTLAAHAGGAADTRAAIAGALYAGYHGSASIPQRWIDDLEARIYVSLAAPWFWRTVAKRRDRLIELRPRA